MLVYMVIFFVRDWEVVKIYVLVLRSIRFGISVLLVLLNFLWIWLMVRFGCFLLLLFLKCLFCFDFIMLMFYFCVCNCVWSRLWYFVLFFELIFFVMDVLRGIICRKKFCVVFLVREVCYDGVLLFEIKLGVIWLVCKESRVLIVFIMVLVGYIVVFVEKIDWGFVFCDFWLRVEWYCVFFYCLFWCCVVYCFYFLERILKFVLIC